MSGFDDEIDRLCDQVEDQIDEWELREAARTLDQLDAFPDATAWVAFHRATIAELSGDPLTAEREYTRAFECDPDSFPLPARMTDDEAMDLLSGIVDRFPADVRAAMDNLRIDLVDVPDPAIDRASGESPLLLGLYIGVPIDEKSDMPAQLPDAVRIFKRNIERLAADRDELEEQLRITLLHEVGHHLGWDEDEVARRGLA